MTRTRIAPAKIRYTSCRNLVHAKPFNIEAICGGVAYQISGAVSQIREGQIWNIIMYISLD